MNNDKINYLFAGAFVSGFIMLMLFILRMTIPDLLDIDVKWLVIAGIPILISLIAGKFIRGFKGMGVELEMQLSSPVIANSTVIEVTSQISSATKQELQFVFGLPEAKKNSTNVLTFRPLQDYYVADDIRQYLQSLPNVQFFEVIDEQLKLKFIIDIRDLRMRIMNFNDPIIVNLIRIIENNTVIDPELRGNIVYENVKPTESLLQAFEKIKHANKDFLPVVDRNGKLYGIVFKNRVSEAIANEVIKAIG